MKVSDVGKSILYRSCYSYHLSNNSYLLLVGTPMITSSDLYNLEFYSKTYLKFALDSKLAWFFLTDGFFIKPLFQKIENILLHLWTQYLRVSYFQWFYKPILFLWCIYPPSIFQQSFFSTYTGTSYSIRKYMYSLWYIRITSMLLTQYSLLSISMDFISLFGHGVILGSHIQLAIFCCDPKSFA